MKAPKTRKAYLSALRTALLWRLPYQEAREIQEDYDGFFAAGLSEGRTEAELCAQFGPPREVARNVWRESGVRMTWRPVLTLAMLLLAAAVDFLCAKGMIRFMDRRLEVLWFVLWLLVPAICLFWRGSLQLPPLEWREGGGLALLHGVTFVIWLIPTGLCRMLLTASLRGDPLPFKMKSSGMVSTICGNTINLCRILALVLFLFALWAAWQRSARYFTVAVHCQAALASLLLLYTTLRAMNLDVGRADHIIMSGTVLLYLLALLPVLVTALLLWWEWRCFQRGRAA